MILTSERIRSSPIPPLQTADPRRRLVFTAGPLPQRRWPRPAAGGALRNKVPRRRHSTRRQVHESPHPSGTRENSTGAATPHMVRREERASPRTPLQRGSTSRRHGSEAIKRLIARLPTNPGELQCCTALGGVFLFIIVICFWRYCHTCYCISSALCQTNSNSRTP